MSDGTDRLGVAAVGFGWMGLAVAEAGKHLWIEKPVGLTARDARAVHGAAASAGVRSTVEFNHRDAPAVRSADILDAMPCSAESRSWVAL